MNADLLLMDDERGRRVAEAHGLFVIGTVGLLIVAKRHGVVESVTPPMDQLAKSGFHMSDALYTRVQALAGEQP